MTQRLILKTLDPDKIIDNPVLKVFCLVREKEGWHLYSFFLTPPSFWASLGRIKPRNWFKK